MDSARFPAQRGHAEKPFSRRACQSYRWGYDTPDGSCWDHLNNVYPVWLVPSLDEKVSLRMTHGDHAMAQAHQCGMTIKRIMHRRHEGCARKNRRHVSDQGSGHHLCPHANQHEQTVPHDIVDRGCLLAQWDPKQELYSRQTNAGNTIT
jgi:hypothetical protein